MLGIIGSAIFTVPTWLEPFLTSIQQKQLEEFLTIASVTASTWAVALFLFAVFIATFLAWREEREAREDAERSSPDELRRELAAVKQKLTEQEARVWQSLTQEQQALLVRFLSNSNATLPQQKHKVCIGSGSSSDSEELAETLCGIFDSSGWDIGSSPVNEMGDRHSGIWVSYPSNSFYGDVIVKVLQDVFGPSHEVLRTDKRDFQPSDTVVISIGRKTPLSF